MEMTRLFECLDFQIQNGSIEDAFAAKHDGQWKKYSTQQVKDIVNSLSSGLLDRGIKKNDKVGIVSFNKPEWVFADLALSQIGAISVPMYPNSTSEDYAFILNDAEVKLIFCGDKELYEKLEVTKKSVAQDFSIYCFESIGDIFWEALLVKPSDEHLQQIDELRNEIANEDLATIIYTSGTTGTPKGVMLSHKNILSNSMAVASIFPISGSGYRTLSFLPLCHIFERTASYAYMQMGISIYYAESMDTIGDNLKEVKPHFFATVPRLLEKVYDKIVAKGYELKGIKKNLFFWALKLGDRYEPNLNYGLGYKLQLALANKIIFSKWREALGGNVQFIVSGAAALQPRLARVFWAAQIHILEAYGLTETSPGISFTRDNPQDVRIGCVGPMLPEVEVKIADDGEILAKGPNIMMGYYKRPDATAEVIDKNGWFHTGDIGEIVEDRYLKITDRKKEMFKTSGGKYIAPQPVENKFKESVLIEQVMVVGESEKFPAALVVPAFDALKEWCHKKGITYTTDKEMIYNEKVLAKFEREKDRYNSDFAQYEKIKKLKLLPEIWTIEGGELTPTLKLKRKNIMTKYSKEVSEIYSE
ncbi:long-chain fatty acid--CoA ligase [Fulvivirga sp.]|uniref:AMP-dependent synthetase/ligase n=1 Tax=Fulvivirga sp. TaxID=1931237 RepID=UPI0032EDE379